jgi:hypothetical protein
MFVVLEEKEGETIWGDSDESYDVSGRTILVRTEIT